MVYFGWKSGGMAVFLSDFFLNLGKIREPRHWRVSGGYVGACGGVRGLDFGWSSLHKLRERWIFAEKLISGSRAVSEGIRILVS